jgi:tRNA(Ile)-lysidine synthase
VLSALHPFVEGVLCTCRRRRLIAPGDRVLVAVSGGADSSALAAALAALRDGGELSAVSAAHVDHGLRPESALDAEAAERLCRALGLPFVSLRVKVPPGNVQAQARQERYRALRGEARRSGATRIATGHTRSDQAETVLLRLLRGAGSRGLSGIPPRRGILVRPLIDRSRAEVLGFLADLGLSWREDPTNATPRYARNRVRHQLMPVLERLAPAAERSLARAADLLRADERALLARARRLASGSDVERDALSAEPEAVRRRVVRLLWARVARTPGELTQAHVEAVLSHLRRRRPWRVSLPGGAEARGRYGRVELVPGAGRVRASALAPVSLPAPGRYELTERRAAVWVSAGNPGLLSWPLELRTRRPGDLFRPERGAGGKKLKAWLIDRRIPREERDLLLMVASGPTILAIPELGVRSREAGAEGASLEVRLEPGGTPARPTCKGGAGLL